jgi:precorrin-6A/cobalt-precorrin-6A reductase
MPGDRILILGGTRDARQLAAVLVGEGYMPITSLAGVTEHPVKPPGDIRVGGFGGVPGLKSYLQNNGIALVIDATHPFAARMSANADEACRSCGVPLLRLERPPWHAGEGDDWSTFATASEAARAIPAGARVLLTTGRKDLQPFFERSDITGIARMIEVPALDVPPGWCVLRERPPFSLSAEVALLRDHGFTHLVTKNAGGDATDAKLAAAREAQIPVLMIARPAKPDVPSFATISNLMAVLKRLLSP